jgi:hypothetical protein
MMRRKYLHVGLTVASMLQTILNQGILFMFLSNNYAAS